METRILIADDDSRVLDAVSHWLQQFPEFGRVLLAKDGREAVDKVRIYKPDAVILDLSMPGMNGIEAAAWVHKVHPDLPIVLLTFHAAETNALHSAGISAVVSKDQVNTTLLSTLRELLHVSPDLAVSEAA